jgi:hypothetical protein
VLQLSDRQNFHRHCISRFAEALGQWSTSMRRRPSQEGRLGERESSRTVLLNLLGTLKAKGVFPGYLDRRLGRVPISHSRP